MNVYIVMRSNCESYEDYLENIDSVWLNRESAVAYIENDLEMKQVDWFNADKRWSRDRWEKEIFDLPRREDFKNEEDWEDAHDENGELIPYWVYRSDAWIIEQELRGE